MLALAAERLSVHCGHTLRCRWQHAPAAEHAVDARHLGRVEWLHGGGWLCGASGEDQQLVRRERRATPLRVAIAAAGAFAVAVASAQCDIPAPAISAAAAAVADAAYASAVADAAVADA